VTGSRRISARWIYNRTDELVSISKNGGFALTASYTATGDLTADPETGTTGSTIAYTYDLAHRLTSITPASGPTTTLGLDALGRPMTRTTGSSVDTYSYLGASDTVVRIANTGGTGAVTDSISDPAGDRLGTKTGSTVAWLTPDLHGSIAAGLAQTAGSVTDAIRYGRRAAGTARRTRGGHVGVTRRSRSRSVTQRLASAPRAPTPRDRSPKSSRRTVLSRD
jgi:YD repeat-containing protein